MRCPLAFCLLSLACAGPTDETPDAGPGSLTGAAAFPVATALFLTTDAPNAALHTAVVGLYPQQVTCNMYGSSTGALELDINCQSSALSESTYAVATVQGCLIGFKGDGEREARGGSITFTAVSRERLAGHFDVTLTKYDGGDASPLSGSFDAPACALP
jgi:hypothetical protein